MNTLKNNPTNLIDNWLEEFGNKEIEKLVHRNVSISNKVIKILSDQKISRVAFADLLEKKPSEITKLLSGRHNFTIKTIVKMEIALGQDLISVSDEAPIAIPKNVYFTVYKDLHAHEEFTPMKVEDHDNMISIAL